MLSKQLQEIYQKSNGEKVHLVTHSFTGVDSRAALSLFGANQYVNTLTTVCTPHLGLRVVDNMKSKDYRYQLEKLDK